jgi:hypothetical protein
VPGDDVPGDDLHAADHVTAAEPDIREVSAAEPGPVDEDAVRVPNADETDQAIGKANRALAEIHARDVADADEAERHRAEQLNQYHAQDRAAEQHDVDDDGAGIEPAGYDRTDTLSTGSDLR